MSDGLAGTGASWCATWPDETEPFILNKGWKSLLTEEIIGFCESLFYHRDMIMCKVIRSVNFRKTPRETFQLYG